MKKIADVVTIIGIIMAIAASVSIAFGSLRLGFVLLIMTGISDALDGPVAKASGAASLRGAFFDSVSDRLTDALLLGGIAWFLIGDKPGYTVMLPVSVMFVSLLISYQRAKAESLGLDAKGGLMERAENTKIEVNASRSIDLILATNGISKVGHGSETQLKPGEAFLIHGEDSNYTIDTTGSVFLVRG